MLTFLKNLFQPQPTVELLGFSDGLLSFTSPKELPMALTTIRTASREGVVDARVSIQSFDEKNQVYRAELVNSKELLPLLQLERRPTQRLTCRLKVNFPGIPGLSGHTEDLSGQGLRLELKRPLREKKELLLTIRLDDEDQTPIQVNAKVRWCASKADGSYHAGLRFLDLEGFQEDTLLSFIETRSAR